MKTFNVVKKNRKYFAAILEGKYKCKLLIDDSSKDLELGSHNLEVDDISVRSKYGTDLIFKIKAGSSLSGGICTLKHDRYNSILREECRRLGGTWDSKERAWIFGAFVEDEVEELDEIFNSPMATYELTFTETLYGYSAPACYCGYTLATATARDSGATLEPNIAIIEGEATSGGSIANWLTKIVAGTVIRMELPALVVEKYAGQHKDDVECKLYNK